MKKISEHLGQIIVALAAIALLVTAVVVFRAPLGGFFQNIVSKETSIANAVLANMDGFGVTDMNGHTMSGDGQVFYQAAPETLSFRSTAPLREFKEVQVNGTTIDRSNYDLKEGSTIVTLKVEYLGTLPEGTYTITIVSESGSLTVTFKVVHGAPEEQNMVLLGDVDENGKVNASDAGRVARHLSGLTTSTATISEIGKFAADVNQDGVVNAEDKTILKKVVAGYEDYIAAYPNIGTEISISGKAVPTIEYYPNLVGDVDGDGKILPGDAAKIGGLVSKQLTLDDVNLVAADANEDKIINQADADMIFNYYTGAPMDGSIVGQYRQDVDNSEYTIEYNVTETE